MGKLEVNIDETINIMSSNVMEDLRDFKLVRDAPAQYDVALVAIRVNLVSRTLEFQTNPDLYRMIAGAHSSAVRQNDEFVVKQIILNSVSVKSGCLVYLRPYFLVKELGTTTSYSITQLERLFGYALDGQKINSIGDVMSVLSELKESARYFWIKRPIQFFLLDSAPWCADTSKRVLLNGGGGNHVHRYSLLNRKLNQRFETQDQAGLLKIGTTKFANKVVPVYASRCPVKRFRIIHRDCFLSLKGKIVKAKKGQVLLFGEQTGLEIIEMNDFEHFFLPLFSNTESNATIESSMLRKSPGKNSPILKNVGFKRKDAKKSLSESLIYVRDVFINSYQSVSINVKHYLEKFNSLD